MISTFRNGKYILFAAPLFAVAVGFLGTAESAKGAGERIISSARDIRNIIGSNNYDVKILGEQVKRASAVVEGIEGAYFPMLSLDTSIMDDRKQPLSNFQPARVENTHWGATLIQRTPMGINFSAGVTNDTAKLYQSDPPNDFLPYPATFNQPVVFLKMEMDILQDLMGFVSFKEWDQYRIDEEVSKMQVELIKHKLFTSSSALLWNTREMMEMKSIIEEMVTRFEKLEKDVDAKVRKRIAEPGDIYKLKALVAQRKADVVALERTVREIEKSIAEILSVQEGIRFMPDRTLASLEKGIDACEQDILSRKEMDTAWSREFDVLEKNIRRGELEKDIRYRKALPDLKLVGSYAKTGTDSTFGDAFSNIVDQDKPQVYVGLNFSWPLSSSVAKSRRVFGDTALATQGMTYGKFYEGSRVFHESTIRKIGHLREEGKLSDEAVGYGRKQIDDLHKRYRQGRVSMFELVQEESSVLQSELTRKRVWVERINNIYQYLGRFDRLSCADSDLTAGRD
ncbi:MAG: TolC family protein [Nitrospinota bacterium]|nr:TolC family protein [Nitrospinota bacterium]